jgi:hypothetical protein
MASAALAVPGMVARRAAAVQRAARSRADAATQNRACAERRIAGMQHLITVLGAVAALASPDTGGAAQQTGIATHAPVAVSTCAVTDLIGSATYAEFGPAFSSRTLQLSFANTNDTAATRVTFDVASGGAHATITDSGRFTKGAPIDRLFGDLADARGDGPATCTVTAVTFADGSSWTAPAGG